jgi:hypothetical protein
MIGSMRNKNKCINVIRIKMVLFRLEKLNPYSHRSDAVTEVGGETMLIKTHNLL